MGTRITELLASSQTAGEQGNVDAAQAAAAQADVVKVHAAAGCMLACGDCNADHSICIASLCCCLPHSCVDLSCGELSYCPS